MLKAGTRIMDNKEFELQFKALGIEVKPLPQNYTPDSYAQFLMKDIPQKPAITYAANTNYKGEEESKKE